MNAQVLKLRQGSNRYYIQFFEPETIADIKLLMSRKYHFIYNSHLQIYQNRKKLENDLKIIHIENRNDLYIEGEQFIDHAIEDEKQNNSSDDNDIISKFHEMRFNESNEIIEQLLKENEMKIEVVISALFLNKKKQNEFVKV